MNTYSINSTYTVWVKPTLLPREMGAIFPLPLRGTNLIFQEIPLMQILSGPLNQARVTKALVKTLDYYPHIISRLRNDEGNLSLIEGKAGIPLTFVETEEPFDHYTPQTDIPAHLFDPITLDRNGSDEPLCRLRITFCCATNETYIGVNFGHVLGDSGSLFAFFSAWSQYYQGLEPISGRPTWDRYKTAPPDADLEDPETVISINRHLPNFKNSYPISEFAGMVEEHIVSSERIDILFTADQIKCIHQIANAWPGKAIFSGKLSIQDSIAAYIITVYNQCLKVPITQVCNIVGYRGVKNPKTLNNSDWQPPGLWAAGNPFTPISTPLLAFEDAKSLGFVAWNIRKSINDTRDYNYLKQIAPVTNGVWSRKAKEQKETKMWQEGGLVFNCLGSIPFLGCHFGFGSEKTRFLFCEHPIGFVRFFAASPVKLADGSWQSNKGCMWVSLRVPKEIREKFLATLSVELNSPAFPQNLIQREKRLLAIQGMNAKL